MQHLPETLTAAFPKLDYNWMPPAILLTPEQTLACPTADQPLTWALLRNYLPE